MRAVGGPARELPAPDYADCLAAFIEALGLGRPIVLGLSFGSGLALELIRRHPGVPRALVLASAYAGWAGSLPAEVVQERLEGCLREADLPAAAFVPGWIPGLLTESAPAEMATSWSRSRPTSTRRVPRNGARLREADLRDVLPQIAVPTLLVYGAVDRRSPPSIGEALQARIPGSRLTVIRAPATPATSRPRSASTPR